MNIATAVKPAPSARDHSRYILRRVAVSPLPTHNPFTGGSVGVGGHHPLDCGILNR